MVTHSPENPHLGAPLRQGHGQLSIRVNPLSPMNSYRCFKQGEAIIITVAEVDWSIGSKVLELDNWASVGGHLEAIGCEILRAVG